MPAPDLLPGPAPARRAPQASASSCATSGRRCWGLSSSPRASKSPRPPRRGSSSTSPRTSTGACRPSHPAFPSHPLAAVGLRFGCGRVAVWLRSGCGCVAPPLRQCLKRLAFCGGLCAAFCLRRPPLPEARQNLVRGGSGGVRHRKIKLDLSLSGASRWHSLDLPGSGSSGSAPAGSARVPDCGNHGGWKHGKHGRTIAANAAALLTWRRR